MRGLQRTHFSGAALVRLLERWAERGPEGEATAPVAERLAQWLAWTDAVALSSALNAPAAVVGSSLVRTAAEERECARVRQALTRSLSEPIDAQVNDDFAMFRRHCARKQKTMEAAVGALRERLRAALAATGSDGARLAALDQVMDQALDARLQHLTSGLPGWLERRFEQARQAHPEHWLPGFCDDVQRVLHAELDLRMQPVEGLLDALRTGAPSR